MIPCTCGDGVQYLIQPSWSPWRILHWCSFHCLQSPYNSCLLSWWTRGRLQFFSNRLFLLVMKGTPDDEQVSWRCLPNAAEYNIFTFMIVVEIITYFTHLVGEIFWIRLWGFDGSFINNGDLNGTRAINSHVSISLALIAFSSDINLGKFFSVPLFLLSCSNLLPLTSFLCGVDGY